jgi:hypothetical protein
MNQLTGWNYSLNRVSYLRPRWPGSFLVMDRAYIDFARLYALHQAAELKVLFGAHDKESQRRTSQTIDRLSGLRSDQTVSLTGPLSREKLYSLSV